MASSGCSTQQTSLDPDPAAAERSYSKALSCSFCAYSLHTANMHKLEQHSVPQPGGHERIGDYSIIYKSSSPWDVFLVCGDEPDWVYLFTTVTTDRSDPLHAGAPSCFS